MYPDSALKLNFEDAESIGFFSWTYDPLNPWSSHAVEAWGQRFITVESAYHYRKFSETAPEVAHEVWQAGSPWAAMRVDRAHREQRRADWHEVKVGIMRELFALKFEQHQDVRECLAATGSKRILETSPVDAFWGVGPDGTGKNTIGQLWMDLRAERLGHKKA